MAQPSRVQPHAVESVAADGTLAVSQGRLRRSGLHIFLHEPSVRHAAGNLRQGTRLVSKGLCGVGSDVRRGGCDTQNEPRLHPLERKERMELHLHRLLSSHRRIRQGHSLFARSDQARGAAQAESPRMVSARTTLRADRQHRRGLQVLQARFSPAPALRTAVQRPHRHDRGVGRRTLQAHGVEAQGYGTQRQQQGLSRPSVLRHG